MGECYLIDWVGARECEEEAGLLQGGFIFHMPFAVFQLSSHDNGHSNV
jgi:hypothetical protein